MIFQLQLCYIIILLETALLSVALVCLVADRAEKHTEDTFNNSL